MGREREYEVPVASLLGNSGGHWPHGFLGPEWHRANREKTPTFGTLGKKVTSPPTGLAPPCLTQNV